MFSSSAAGIQISIIVAGGKIIIFNQKIISKQTSENLRTIQRKTTRRNLTGLHDQTARSHIANMCL